MRRVHATSRQQLAKLPLGTGWFDLDDVAFEAESARVVVPFRVLDDAVVVEASRGFIRRLLRRSPDRYAPWRRWFLVTHGALELHIKEDLSGEKQPEDRMERGKVTPRGGRAGDHGG